MQRCEEILTLAFYMPVIGKILRQMKNISNIKTVHLNCFIGTSLVAQWIRLHAPNAGGPGLIPGQGTRSHMHAATKSSHATTKEPTCHN